MQWINMKRDRHYNLTEAKIASIESRNRPMGGNRKSETAKERELPSYAEPISGSFAWGIGTVRQGQGDSELHDDPLWDHWRSLASIRG